MATPSPSGTYAFLPTLADVALECFDRLGIRAAEITPDHFISMKRSMNLVFTSWSNRGVNLWLIDTQTVNLAQGVATYSVPTDTVNVEEAWIRFYQMAGATNVTPNFATTLNSPTVTATQANHGYAANGFINVEVPVAVGGLILSGYYEVVSVPSNNSYTFKAAANATATTSGGAVPAFTTTAASTSVSVALAAHGLLAGQPFVVGVATYVGGITLLGSYNVTTVTNPNAFTITALQVAGSTDTQSENGGQTSIAGQQTAAGPTDRIMWPFSRVDWSNLPNKTVQGFPTNFYYDRQINPSVTLWPVPNGSGPYQLLYNRTTQPQDANPQGAQTPFLPYRFLESFHADVTAHMAIKWAQPIAKDLIAYAADRWSEAAATDAEMVTTHIMPMLDSYYRA